MNIYSKDHLANVLVSEADEERWKNYSLHRRQTIRNTLEKQAAGVRAYVHERVTSVFTGDAGLVREVALKLYDLDSDEKDTYSGLGERFDDTPEECQKFYRREAVEMLQVIENYTKKAV